MAILTVQTISRTGINPTFAAAAAGGDSFANDGKVFFECKNANAATRTLTFALTQLVDGQTPAAKTVVVPVTPGDSMVGPFPPSVYNDSNGRVVVTYSAEADLTVAAFRLPD